MSRARASRITATLLAAAAAAALAPAARADWLVTRDGARVETAGPWQVKGKLVVFKTAAGDLASLRLAEVDLETSRAVTAEADAAAAASAEAARKPPPKRRPLRVLTDKDFPRAAPPAPPEGGADAAAPPPPAASAPTAGAVLQVTSWERENDSVDRHVAITGALRNTAAATAADAGLVVSLYDEAGGLIASVVAELASTVLPAGETTGFRADFPGVFAFAAVKFETSAMRLETAPEPGAPPAPPAEGQPSR